MSSKHVLASHRNAVILCFNRGSDLQQLGAWLSITGDCCRDLRAAAAKLCRYKVHVNCKYKHTVACANVQFAGNLEKRTQKAG